jgi:hypothetical protein
MSPDRVRCRAVSRLAQDEAARYARDNLLLKFPPCEEAPAPGCLFPFWPTNLVLAQLVSRLGHIVKTLPLAEAKLSGLIDDVTRRDERVTITKHGVRPQSS